MTFWNPTVYSKNVPKECREQIANFQNNGHRILCVAFPPEGGNRWSVITDKGFFNRNVPDPCHAKMAKCSESGDPAIWVAFPAPGGNRWSIITAKGKSHSLAIPDECKAKMASIVTKGQKLVSVSFHPNDPDCWSVISDKDFFNRGTPPGCHEIMTAFKKAGDLPITVSFPFTDGAMYTVVTKQGNYFCSAPPEGCVRVIQAMKNCGAGPLHAVVHTPLRGYVIFSAAKPGGAVHPVLEKNGKRFSLDTFATNLKVQLDGKVCKYGFMLRYMGAMRASVSGLKRGPAHVPDHEFTVYDWFNPASVTKTITAVALLHCLHHKGLTTTEKISKYLPKSWSIPESIKTITVKELLRHRSGIRSAELEYLQLKSVVEAGVSLDAKKIYSYQGANYALARIVLAYLSGYNGVEMEFGVAAQFIGYVQEHVLDPLGVTGVEWRPDKNEPTIFYPHPHIISPGTSYGDFSLKPGSAGIHLSIAELSMFLAKLANSTVLLSAALRTEMDSDLVGWGESSTADFRWKGGYFPASKNKGAELQTAIGKFSNGVQLVIMYNGSLGKDFMRALLNTAYAAAWV